MEKMITLDKDVFGTITVNGKLSDDLRRMLEIPASKNYGIGDTMVMLNTSCGERDVFKLTNSNKETRYYVVIDPIDERMTYCYSIYERR